MLMPKVAPDQGKSKVESEITGRKARRLKIPQGLRIPLMYLTALTVAESLTTLTVPQVGLILHGLLLATLILHAALFARGAQQRFLISLTLAPLIRLMSLSLPLPKFPFVYWYALVGVPLFLATFLAIRVTGFKSAHIGLNGRALPWQLVVGLTGLGLGYVEYLILRPTPLIIAMTWQQIWLPALILLIFTGLLEEVIFRGLIQRSAAESLGRFGILYGAALFAILHLGYRSILDVLFVFMVALFFGTVVARTGSILGVTLSHGLTNVSLYLLIPFLVGLPSTPAETAATVVPRVNTLPTAGVTPAVITGLLVTASPAPTLIPSVTPYVSPIPLSFVETPTLVPLSPTPTPTPLILDDSDTGVTSIDGQWWAIEAGIGGDLHWAYAVGGEPTTIVEWRPMFSDCGIYSLDVYLTPKYSTTRSARYQIGHRLGTTEVVFDQSAHQGEWAGLGVYEFLPGEGSYLRLTNATGEDESQGLLVVFDAARWTFVMTCETNDTP